MLLQSPLYPVLSTLPPADPTSPKATSIFNIQVAIHNTLPVLEEIVQLLETDEDERMKKEFDKRRMRLGAPKPEILKKEVQQEMLGESQASNLISVREWLVSPTFLTSCRDSMTRF